MDGHSAYIWDEARDVVQLKCTLGDRVHIDVERVDNIQNARRQDSNRLDTRHAMETGDYVESSQCRTQRWRLSEDDSHVNAGAHMVGFACNVNK